MSPDYKNIFTQSSCLTNSEMIDYLSGNLSADKIRKVEFHLSDCEMCNDELEGLSNLKDTKQLPIIVNSLNNKIDSYFKEKIIIPPITKTETKTFNIKRVLSIAASIALLVTVGYFINDFANKTSSDLAQAEMSVEDNIEEEMLAVPEHEESLKKAENISEINEEEKNNTITLNNNTNIVQTANESVDNIIITEDLDEEDVSEITDDIIEVEEETVLVSPSEAPAIISADKTVTEDEGISFGGTRRSIMKSKTEKKSSVDYSNLKRSGLLSYDIKSYKEAIADFDKYLPSNPKDFEIIYKSGMSYFYMDKYSTAISRFNKIISNKNIKYFEDAQWYKATALLNQGKKNDALTILKQIESANGKYSKKAKDVIAIMNN